MDNDETMKCEFCKKKSTPKNPVTYGPNPLEVELNSDYTGHWLCKECRDMLFYEI